MYWIKGFDMTKTHSLTFFDPKATAYPAKEYDIDDEDKLMSHRFYGKQNTAEDWVMAPSSRPVVTVPPVNVHSISVPGGNGELDLTTSLTGFPTYGNRTGSFEFIVMNDIRPWTVTYDMLLGYMQGRAMQMIAYDEPNYYYEGRMSLNAMKSDQHNSQITIDYSFKPFKMEVTRSDENELWDCYDFEYGCTIGDLFTDIPLLPQYQTQKQPNPSVAPSTAYSINFSKMPKLMLTDDDKKWDVNATTADTKAVYDRITEKLNDTVDIPFELRMAKIVLGAKPLHLRHSNSGLRFPANSQSGFSYNAFCQIDNPENIFHTRVRMMKTIEQAFDNPDSYIAMEPDPNAMLSNVNASSRCIITFWHDYDGDGTYELTGRHFSLLGLRRGYL